MITPLILPKAAGLPYGNGDVRHLTNSDANTATSISFATRNLAERDNVLAEVINQLISEVNNKEQIIDLPIPRISLSTSQSTVVLNYRIPSGFEARVLNGVVASTPSNTVRVEVLWSSTYGATTGTSVASTLTEVSGQTTFYGEGEFIIKVTNIGGATAEVCADVQITMRPVAVVQGSLLIPTTSTNGGGSSGYSGISGVSGNSGFSGTRGASGFSGYSGTNGTGSPAYTTVTTNFTMPGETSSVTVYVGDNTWMTVGQIIYIATAGYLQVASKTSTNQISATNPAGYGQSGGGVISSGVGVSPGGLRGISGYSGGSSSIASTTANITTSYSGTTTSVSGSYAALVNGAGSYTIAVTTLTLGANTFRIIQGQLLVMMRTGNLILTLPSPFTTSNTFVTVTVDDAFQTAGQTYKVITPASTIQITLPAGYTADTRVAISYIGIVVT